MNEFFQDSLRHLFSELKYMELKLRLQTIQIRQQNSSGREDKFRGLYISDNEIDSILNAKTLQLDNESPQVENPAAVNLSRTLDQMQASISAKSAESLKQGIRLRLVELEKSFSLSRFDIDVLLACVLPEIDLRFQKLYGYLQDDVTRKSPSVDLLLRILSTTFEGKLRERQAFSSDSSLIKYHLVYLEDERGYSAPLLAKSLRVDERILNYLLESDEIDSRLRKYGVVTRSEARLSDIILPEETRKHLARFTLHSKDKAPICNFQGSSGIGKKTTAQAICRELEKPLLVVDIDNLIKTETNPEPLLPLIFREGLLQNSALYLDNCDALFVEDKGVESIYRLILSELGSYPAWSFISTEKPQPNRGILPSKPIINVEFPAPTAQMRAELWEKNRDITGELGIDVELNDLAARFKLNAGQIKAAATSALNNALWRDPENQIVNSKDLYSACRQQSNSKLSALARKINPKYEWDDIVLPKDQLEQLGEMCNYVKHYQTVYSLWGFEKKLSLGKGLNALFAGPSGTGKTMAAEIIAKQLGIDLYKINLSAIVSKYIGETEKNLENIFKEGQTANAILFFDEADALFGKRSDVRDSHDRYANIEIAYLLQRMEEYDGVVILATNMQKNMDDAFVRRLHNNIEFPMPEESDRLRIWQQVFPTESPLSKEIDLAFLARQFKISGGNIKNIALGAAFLAAADQGTIKMDHLIRATKREFQKMGKLCTEGDFAKYYDMVKN
jgi:AAA+ superfamily predicted ATPase